VAGIGVALSGGGHRASLWGLGALLYLVDSGSAREVSSIASVSGGSITNGVVAQRVRFRETDPEAFREVVAPLARRLAVRGTFQHDGLSAPRKRAILVAMALSLLVFAVPGLTRWIRFAIFLVAVLVWGIGLIPPLFETARAKLYAVILVTTLFLTLVVWWVVPMSYGGDRAFVRHLVGGIASPAGRWILFLLSLAVWAKLVAERRGVECAIAFRDTLFRDAYGRVPLLDEINADDIDHVFCATELQSGDQIYFGKAFVYGYRFGKGTPVGLPLHEAVQASADLPFAFPPKPMSSAAFGFAYQDPTVRCPRERDRLDERQRGSLLLTDGGVYDNMGDQWAAGYRGRRTSCWPTLDIERQPDALVVVNASAGFDWVPSRRTRLPLVGEISGLLKVKDVLYDQTTAQRRWGLVGRFDRAELEGRGLRGALVHIPQSPYAVIDGFKDSPSWQERRSRALKAKDLFLDTDADREAWQRIADDNAAVPTVLSALGEDVAARLLHHAYVLAMVNMYVILGTPLADRLPPREHFLALVRQTPEPPTWAFTDAPAPP
jgi:predicted acylesterase/phospholipase RssA